MRAKRITANLRVVDIGAANGFYTGYLGLTDEEFNLGAEDVEAAYEEARRLGYEIVHPLTTEPWGVYRFFVRAPDGNVVNIVQHRR